MRCSKEDVVFRYTRADAVRDGVQVELTAKFPELDQLFGDIAVFCTDRVWRLLNSADSDDTACNDLNGVLWDIGFMALMSPSRKAIAKNVTEFTVIVTEANIAPDFYEDGSPIYRLHIISGPVDIDDNSPAITFAFPGED